MKLEIANKLDLDPEKVVTLELVKTGKNVVLSAKGEVAGNLLEILPDGTIRRVGHVGNFGFQRDSSQKVIIT